MNDFEKRKCLELTNKMLHKDLCRPFREKVDPERDGAPDYLDVIKHPIDLTTIRKKLVSGEYKSTQEWSDDVNLIFSNAKLYNDAGSLIYLISQEMEQWFSRKLTQLPKNKEEEWMVSLRKYSTVLSRLSNHPPSSIVTMHTSLIENSTKETANETANEQLNHSKDHDENNEVASDNFENNKTETKDETIPSVDTPVSEEKLDNIQNPEEVTVENLESIDL